MTLTGVFRVHRHPDKTRAAVASRLQRSDAPGGDAVPEAVRRSVRQLGVRRCCTGLMAREVGDHPEAAMDRMRLDPAACRRDTCELRPPGPRQHLTRRLIT
jgi:hypothetical protein